MTKSKDKMRIWHLSSNRWNSAITEYALSNCRSLDLDGCDNFFSPLQGSPCEKRCQQYGFKGSSFRSFHLSEVFKFLYQLLKIRPHVIFTYGGRETSLCQVIFLLFFFLPKPKLIRFRGFELRKISALENLRLRLGSVFVTKILSPSFRLSAKLSEVLGKEKVGTVQLGVDTEVYFRSDNVPKLVYPRPRFLIFGRFDPVKGHGRAIGLFSQFLQQLGPTLPKPALWIAGHEENLKSKDLTKLICEHGLNLGEDVIVDVGRFSNVAELMASSTLGWISSLGSEIICRVAEEFLLCGTPVFVSGVGSLDEVLFGPEAGVSYNGLTDDQIVAQLTTLYKRSLQETGVDKVRRAIQSREIYSLGTMGQRIRVFLGD